MKPFLYVAAVALVLAVVIASTPFHSVRAAGNPSEARVPVLVELFTSEGCSSCPPADRLLQQLDQQPVAGADLIVLSEHVDYWNHIGWRDPYSASFCSDRQSTYSGRFDLRSVYTPQMVVDGESEFVGNDPGEANKAFAKAVNRRKLSVQLSSVSHSSNSLSAHLDTAALDGSLSSHQAEVYLVVALNHAEQQVSRGENSGHRLTHVGVVRSLTKIGVIKPGQSLNQNIDVKLDAGADSHNLRLIAFVQEPNQGRVLGATSIQVEK